MRLDWFTRTQTCSPRTSGSISKWTPSGPTGSRPSNGRSVVDPCLIPNLLSFYAALDNLNKVPKPEDYINKEELQSNDVFCLVFSLLVLCDRSFVKCFTYLASHSDALIRFNRPMFCDLLGRFFLNISDDKNLVFVLKKLINVDKYKSGTRSRRSKMKTKEH